MSERAPAAVSNPEIVDYRNVDYHRGGDSENGEIIAHHIYGIDNEGKKIHVAVDDMLVDRGYDPGAYKEHLADPTLELTPKDLERQSWDREQEVIRAKAGLMFAKHGYSRKERKTAVEEEALRLETKIKTERQNSDRIPIKPVEGIVNNIKQNIIFKREMKRAVRDSKAFAELEIGRREQAAAERLEDFREAYKDVRHERKRARHAQLARRLYPNGKRPKFNVLPNFYDPGPRVHQAPGVEVVAAPVLEHVTAEELESLRRLHPNLYNKYMASRTK